MTNLKRPPKKGAFDYLLDGIRDEVPPPREPPRGPRVIVNIEITQAPPKPVRIGWMTRLVLILVVAVLLGALR